jgi:hypothetical protein
LGGWGWVCFYQPHAGGAIGGVPWDVQQEAGWVCLEVAGPFAFEVVGVLAALAGVLAEAGVPILAVSTFRTDYLLVKGEMLARAVDALRRGGHAVERIVSS